MRKKPNIILFCLLLLQGAYGKAQFQEIQFYDYNLDFSQKTGMCALHDYRGFMWFGTLHGLDRYDGVELKVYFNHPRGLASNSIFALYQDSRHDIWVGTPFGISRYIKEADDFERFRFDSLGNRAPVQENIRCILEDSGGHLWAASSSLLLYSRDKNNFHKYAPPLTEESGQQNIYGLVFEDSQKNLWYAYWKHLYIFDRDTETFRKIKLDFEEAPGLADMNWHYLSMDEDREGKIWIAVNNAGLASFMYNGQISDYTFYEADADDPNSLNSERISDLLIDSKNRIWLSFNDAGIARFNRSENNFIRYQHDPEAEFSLSEEGYVSLYEDRNGRLWLGGNTEGFDVVDPYWQKFIKFQHHEECNSISHNSVYCFTELPSGEILIGNESGVDLYDPARGEFSYCTMNKSGPEIRSVQTVYKDPDGNIWLGTWGRGVFVLNKEQKLIHHFTVRNSGLTNDIVCNIAGDRKNKVYMATYGGGLVEYDLVEKTWNAYFHDEADSTSLADNSLFTLYVDSKDRLWIGTVGAGLDLKFRDKRGQSRFEHFPQDTIGNDNNISGSTVQSIIEDNEGYLWLGTNNGLDRFEYERRKFTAFTVSEGLPNNSVRGVLADDHGNLWIGTLRGLARMDIKTHKIRSYSIVDGIQGLEYSRSACYKMKDGRMLFGGTRGFNIFYPDSIKDNPHKPELVFTDFRLFNKSVSPGEKSLLEVPITETKEIVLSHKDNVITLQFAALNFTHPELNQYAYIMEGFEEDWNYVGTQNTATYTNLDPGEYYFRVKASNNDNIWNEEGISLRIRIKPPYWRTLGFRIGVVLVVILLLVAFYYYRLRSVTSQKIKLEQTVRERTNEITEKNEMLEGANLLLKERQEEIISQNEELEQHRNNLEELVKDRTVKLEEALAKARESDELKSAFLANMSHEIRTPMNAITGFAGLLNEIGLTAEERADYTRLIQSNSRALLGIIDEILDLSLLESNQFVLFKENIELNVLIDHLYSFYYLSNQESGIEIRKNNELQDNNLVLYTDSKRMKQVITHLLDNSVKFTSEGHIELGVNKDKTHLYIYVEDTGRGIPEENLKHIFEQFTKVESNNFAWVQGMGLGLAISQKITSKLGGRILVESTEGKGSTFTISLPLTEIMTREQIEVEELRAPLPERWINKTILIAEDVEANYLYLKNVLKKTQINILWAKDGNEAIELVKKHPEIALVLMDIKMPYLDGYEAAKRIKALKSGQVIVAQTAYARPEEKMHFQDENFDEYLAKPISRSQLISVLEKYL